MIVCRGLGVDTGQATPIVSAGLGIQSLMEETVIERPAAGGRLIRVQWNDSSRFKQDEEILTAVLAFLEVLQ